MMGKHSPGRFRKEGREAYMPGVDNPEDYFDWPKKSWHYKYNLPYFLEGWKEAESDYNKQEVVEIDLDEEAWNQIKEAAKNSLWMPDEYTMNDWVSDACNFLRYGRDS